MVFDVKQLFTVYGVWCMVCGVGQFREPDTSGVGTF